MKRIALPALLWTAVALTVTADDRWQVTAHVDVFQVPEKDALSLIPRLSDPNESTAALNSLTEKTTEPDGKTQQVATITARTLDGLRAVYRNGEEMRYPIEYEQEDPRIGVPPNAPITLPDATGYPATTFETRNCGVSLELSAKVHPDGSAMLLECAVKHTLFHRWTLYESTVRADGLKLYVQQPEIIDRSSSAVVLATPGKPILLGSYRMLEKEGMFELHVLSASARRLEVNGIKVPSLELAPGETIALTPDKFPNRALRIEVLTFSLSAREAVKYREQLLDIKEAARALDNLIAQSGSDSVKLIDWQSVPSVSGNRAVTQNAREFRYGIEFESGSFGGFGQPHEHPNWDGGSLFEPMTTFETRNMGALLEVECESAETLPSFVRMQFATSNVTLPHFLRWGAGPHRNGKATYIYQPQFEHRSSSANANMKIETPHLVRFAKEPGASNRFEIAILRVHNRRP